MSNLWTTAPGDDAFQGGICCTASVSARTLVADTTATAKTGANRETWPWPPAQSRIAPRRSVGRARRFDAHRWNRDRWGRDFLFLFAQGQGAGDRCRASRTEPFRDT